MGISPNEKKTKEPMKHYLKHLRKRLPKYKVINTYIHLTDSDIEYLSHEINVFKLGENHYRFTVK